MSATFTATGTRIRTIGRSYTVVANEIAGALLRLADHYGTAEGILNRDLEKVLHALRVWITVKQLETVSLELYAADGRLLRRWELPLDYTESDADDEQYETNWDKVQAFLARDRPPGVARYRLVLSLNTPHGVHVPGWKSAKRADASHLERHDLATTVVSTKHARASVVVYLDPPQRTKG